MIKPGKNNALKLLQQVFNKYDEESGALKEQCLAITSQSQLNINTALPRYFDLMLFLLSHPGNERQSEQVEKELARISSFLAKPANRYHATLDSTGLPFTNTRSYFSHDLLVWMLERGDYIIQVDALDENGTGLNDILKLSLPSLEREFTTYGFNNRELLDTLKIRKKSVTEFLIRQLSVFDTSPLLKDKLFEMLELTVKIKSGSRQFSRGYNRFLKAPLFYHQSLLKRFDYLELFRTPLPPHYPLLLKEQDALVKTIKDSLTLMARETDPATYMDESSLRFYQLDRGIAVAIYGMCAPRQLPLETYIGYTLFKNGFPAAYGGAWVFGKRSLFGINILESFRGGESGYMMCQLLRVYHQVFKIGCFEVEPYQFGKDNPDGIRSGAFWFYYRHGFRPVDRHLRKIAADESKKIAGKKGYQTNHKTLVRFTDSFICLELEKTRSPKVSELAALVTKYIDKAYRGDRRKASLESVARFIELTGAVQVDYEKASPALKEFALLRAALKIEDKARLELLKSMVELKHSNMYDYQEALTAFLNSFYINSRDKL